MDRAGIGLEGHGESLVLATNRYTYLATAVAEGIDLLTLRMLTGYTNQQARTCLIEPSDQDVAFAAEQVAAALIQPSDQEAFAAGLMAAAFGRLSPPWEPRQPDGPAASE